MLYRDLLFFFFSFSLSVVLYPLLINLLYKFQFKEKIREYGPATHKKKAGTPKMGGLGFVIITLLINLIFNFNFVQTALIIFVTTLAAIMGFIEDWYNTYGESKFRKKVRKEVYVIFSRSRKWWNLYNLLLVPWSLFREFSRIIGSNASNKGVKLKSHYKFLMHLFLGVFISFWVYFKLGWSSMLIPFVGELEMGILYPVIITFFFVFTLNAVAITDGLDGLLGGLSLLMLVPYWVISYLEPYYTISTLISILFGALVVYLYFNIYPARIFMSDVGSYALGALLFIIPLFMRLEFLIIITHAVSLFDGGVSGLSQQFSVKFFNKRIFKMAPIHHHFEELGWPETKVTLRFWIVQIFFSFLGLLLYFYI